METHGIVGRGLSVVKEVISLHVIQFEEMVDGAGVVIGVKDVANVDKVMVHDVSGPGVLKVFDKLKNKGVDVSKLWDPTKVWVAEDHFVPSAEKISAENIVKLSNFTKNYGIEKHFKYGMGQYGICHTLSHEEAMVLPGEVYVGGDSHTNTTGALGAFACGLGHTDIAYVLLNGKIWFKVP